MAPDDVARHDGNLVAIAGEADCRQLRRSVDNDPWRLVMV
jgi:hypothetical protein